jgi:phage host-nuclease inhibitor protein Gam
VCRAKGNIVSGSTEKETRRALRRVLGTEAADSLGTVQTTQDTFARELHRLREEVAVLQRAVQALGHAGRIELGIARARDATWRSRLFWLATGRVRPPSADGR